jgi:plastocyanin
MQQQIATGGRHMSNRLATVAMTVALTACVSGAKATSEPVRLDTGDGAVVVLEAVNFDPADVEVDAGTSVTWKWGGGVDHDVASDDFSSAIQNEGTFQHTFDQAGTYSYRCNLHPGMRGTVTVVSK